MNRDKVREQAADIFLKAAEYIREYGWQVEGMAYDGQPRCSMGALASAYPKTKWGRELSEIMYQSLYKELRGVSLTQFNHHYRDGKKVAELYECVASKLRINAFALVK